MTLTALLAELRGRGIRLSLDAGRLRCKILCEGANGPTTAVADGILRDKKIFVIPDILANAGGVTVSYLEWKQNLAHEHWEEARVVAEMTTILKQAAKDVIDMQKQSNQTYRTAAFMVALKRLEASKS